MSYRFRLAILPLVLVASLAPCQGPKKTLTGTDALGDWTTERTGRPPEDHRGRPGQALRHALGQEQPEGRQAARRGVAEGARRVRGEGIATGLTQPRVITCAPNGDLFVAESAPTASACSATRTATASWR